MCTLIKHHNQNDRHIYHPRKSHVLFGNPPPLTLSILSFPTASKLPISILSLQISHLQPQCHFQRLSQLPLSSSHILNHLRIHCSFTILEIFFFTCWTLYQKKSSLPSLILWGLNDSSRPSSNIWTPQAAWITLCIVLWIYLVYIYINDLYSSYSFVYFLCSTMSSLKADTITY